MLSGIIDKFIVVIDGQDRAHLLRLDLNELTGELTTDAIPDFSLPELQRVELDNEDIIELCLDWLEVTFYYEEHDSLGDEQHIQDSDAFKGFM